VSTNPLSAFDERTVGERSTMAEYAGMTARPAHFIHLNGPALVGLAARTLERQYGLEEFMPARLTVDLFKAARGIPTTTTCRLVHDGRRVRNSVFLRVDGDAGGWSPSIGDYVNTSHKRFLNRAIDVVQGSANSPFVNAAYAAEWICVQGDSHSPADGVSGMVTAVSNPAAQIDFADEESFGVRPVAEGR